MVFLCFSRVKILHTAPLIWPQRNTTGLPDIKRRNPRNGATDLHNTKISAKCDTYFCQPGNHVYARSLHWINALAFWKHLLASSLAISTSIFYSQKSVIHQVFTYERERMKERERCCVCMNDHRNSKAGALIPSETMMLPAPCWEI